MESALRDAHPLAQRLFRGLEGGSDVDRRTVFEALRRRLATDRPEHLVEIAEALCACADDLALDAGPVPERKYVEWRRSGRGAGAPSPASIRRLGHGSWSRGCAAALSLPTVDPVHRRLFRSRAPHSREAMLDAVRRFVASLPEGMAPSRSRYGPWAAGLNLFESCDVRVPLSAGTMDRAFGSWTDALRAAGIEPDHPSWKRFRRTLGFSREDAIRGLRIAAKELGPPVTMNRYDEWVFRCDDSRPSSPGDARDAFPVPYASSISTRFGGWRSAIRAVLGPDFPVARSRSREYSDDDLARAWGDFIEQFGQRPTASTWSTYREMTRAGEQSYLLPSASTLMQRLGGGSWARVCCYFGCVDVPAPRRSRPWTDAQLIAAWEDCKCALGAAPGSQHHYDLWRERRRGQDHGTLPPTSSALIRRLGDGSWRDLFIRLEDTPPPRGRAGCRCYPAAQIQEAWQEAKRFVDRPPSMSDYERYRTKRITETGGAVAVPTIGVFLRRFGTWRELHLQLEGVEPSSLPTRRPDVELIAIVRACASQIGRPPSINAYERWCTVGDLSTGNRRPKYITIARRLGQGSWPAAVRRALGEVPPGGENDGE